MEEKVEKCLKRAECEYKNRSERFRLPLLPDYDSQYNSIYRTRLTKLRPILQNAAWKKWGHHIQVKRAGELHDKEECILIGTVVKHQELRYSVLKQLANHLHLYPVPIRGLKLTKDTDHIELEDDMQTVQLCGKIQGQLIVTGVVVGLLGQEIRGDVFYVQDVVYPPLADQPPRPLLTEDKFVMFISGLEFSGRECDGGERFIETRLLGDWLTGSSGSLEEQEGLSAKVCRVIIAGNSIARTVEERDFTQLVRKLTNKRHSPPSVEKMRNFDRFLARIVPCVPVDLIPGDNDPTTVMQPHQPLHKCMFRTAGKIRPNNLNLVTDPYEASLDGRILLGTSGANLDDIYRYSARRPGMDLLYSTFVWQHLAPSAPDTIDGYPYFKEEPFLMSKSREESECPDIFFAGNQGSKLEFKYVDIPQEEGGQRCLLMALPSFRESGQVVLVNLKNLEFRILEFGGEKFEQFGDEEMMDVAE